MLSFFNIGIRKHDVAYVLGQYVHLWVYTLDLHYDCHFSQMIAHGVKRMNAKVKTD